MRTLLIALIAAGSLSACVVQPARVQLRSPIVLEPARIVVPVYGDDGGHHHWHGDDDGRGYYYDYRGGFCPPGQAMKGRC
ncbi:vir-repressed protein [Vogesella oryzae]|uniref:vir-repressed protein n=1 Tax=Vogesella oryzae TaxID=1735285 RepID=UPI0015833F4B|nr:vir-repressed protein [Vogesella oryzae]